MTTLRKELTKAGFDFKKGIILYNEVKEDEDYEPAPGYANEADLAPIQNIEEDSEILDKEFYDGFGSPQMPRFWAKCFPYVYFPVQYDGSTSIGRVPIDDRTMLKDKFCPYVGG